MENLRARKSVHFTPVEILLLHSALFEKLVEASMLRVLVGTTYCQHIHSLSIPQLFLTRMLPTIIKLKLIFFPQHHHPPQLIAVLSEVFLKKKKD